MWKKEYKDTDVAWKYDWVVVPKSLTFEQFKKGEGGDGKIPSLVRMTASRSYLRATIEIPPHKIPQIILDNPEGVSEKVLEEALNAV